ncbi:MAG: hypothetical protein QOE31_2940, partial [Solirubrobacteraceae bacterium]|nr:hypothetical protein [Solirubrobacteraceae bacterium]
MSIIATDSESWIGSTLIAEDGRALGTIEAVYYDAETGVAQWMAIRTHLSDSTHTFVPQAGAVPTEDGVVTPYDAAIVFSAPQVEAHEDLPDDQTLALYLHYGVAYDAPAEQGIAVVDPALTATDPGTQSEHDMLIATGRLDPYAAPVVVEREVVVNDVP